GHMIEAAKVSLNQAELARARTEIRAPITGRILHRFAMPGQKRMLAMDDPDSSTIASLYDPEKLQVRVDVPLADAAQLTIGQHARIRSKPKLKSISLSISSDPKCSAVSSFLNQPSPPIRLAP
ncbi:MAG: HlyD family efflux transporter periplasmic adaptor subunit, partial [Verrucomicrobiales bacterium]